MTSEIAIAASAREWPDRLHRHILDHGGGRVVARLMTAEQALDIRYDVLVIDDVCSFLTPRLVSEVKAEGVDVIGVFSPNDGSDAKRRLLECGISDVIESDATPEEFLVKIAASISHRAPAAIEPQVGSSSGYTIGVTGSIAGSGITEVAVTLACELATLVDSVLLADLDPEWPSVAQRLDLPVHPNLRTALDMAMHEPDRVADALHSFRSMSVLTGVVELGRVAPLAHVEVSMLLQSLSASSGPLVADLGPFGMAHQTAVRAMDTLIVVGTADPVGVSRLLRTIEAIEANSPYHALVAAVNMSAGRRFRDAEIRFELSSAYPSLPVVLLPIDGRMAARAWEGAPMDRGPFARKVRRMAKLVGAELAG